MGEKRKLKRAKPCKPGASYAEIFAVVDGALRDTINKHPTYVDMTRESIIRSSFAKRITGGLVGYFAQAEESHKRRLAASGRRPRD